MEFNKLFQVDGIEPELDESLLLTRLSYKKTRTTLEPDLKEEIDLTSSIAVKLARPIGVYTLMPITIDSENISFADIKIKSQLVREKLMDCIGVVCMAVTLGSKIDEATTELFNKNEYTKAVVLDFAASCIADKSLELLRESVDNKLNAENMNLGKFRISPGQLDIPLSIQKSLYDILELNSIGVGINEAYMLTPQKSVISLAGFSIK